MLTNATFRTVLIAVALFVSPLLASDARAQRLTLSVNLSVVPGSFDYGPVITHRVDEDGDGVSDSFLQETHERISIDLLGDAGSIELDFPKYRLVRVVKGKVCRGAWLDPKHLAGVTGVWNEHHARVDLVMTGTRHELQVSYDTDATAFTYLWANVKAFSIDRVWVACQ